MSIYIFIAFLIFVVVLYANRASRTASPRLTPLAKLNTVPLADSFPFPSPYCSPEVTPTPPPSTASHIILPRIRIGNHTLEWDSELDVWEEEQQRLKEVWWRRAPEWRAQADAGDWRRFVLARNATQRFFGK
ncbi:hypothetical protein BJV82DRAFT_664459 [Fennellomyces sp. T-0311]|nr:hypothetical protein BJV82DRAFT_664459 [Fennellomyces sp. T-0311]